MVLESTVGSIVNTIKSNYCQNISGGKYMGLKYTWVGENVVLKLYVIINTLIILHTHIDTVTHNHIIIFNTTCYRYYVYLKLCPLYER